jgi:hypothetical protein
MTQPLLYALVLAAFTAWTFAPILARLRAGSLDLFETGSAFRGILWLYSGPRALFYLLQVPSYLPYAYGRDGIALTMAPLVLTFVGLIVFDTGYYLVSRNFERRVQATFVPEDRRGLLLGLGATLVVLSVLAHAYEVAQFGVGRFFADMYEFRDTGRIGTGPIEVVKQCLGLGIGLITLTLRRKRWAVVWVLMASPAMVLSGSKFAFVLYLFPAVVFLRYSRLWLSGRRVTLYRLAVLAAVLVMLAGTIGVMTIYRRNAPLLRSLDWRSPAAYGTVFRYTAAAFNRFHAFEVFALTLEQYRTRDLWADGDWVLDIGRQLVPRAIWRSKPMIMTTTLSEFVRQVKGSNYFYPPFVIGLFLFDFGTPGLLASMFVLGIVMALAYQALVLERAAVLPRMVYAFWVYLLLMFAEGNIHALSKLLYVSALVATLYVVFVSVLPVVLSTGAGTSGDASGFDPTPPQRGLDPAANH